LRRAGSSKEIWLAEVGYSSFRPSAEISETYTTTYRYEHTPEFQAASLFRMLVPVLASGKVSTVAWYRINDLPHTEDIIGDANNRHLGILTTNRLAKPSLKALQFFQELFGGGVAPADQMIRVTTSASSDSETHAFINGRGELVVATWLKVISPRAPTSKEGNAHDSREERLTVHLPRKFATAPRLYNSMGRELRNDSPRGKQTVQLTLRGGEVLVVVSASQ
jgi:hypothetical protein